MSRKTLVMGLAGAALLLVGLLGGVLIGGRLTAHASPSTQQPMRATGSGMTKYCQIYEQTLAGDLNTNTSALEQANIKAAGAALDAMAHDGQITATEAAQGKALLAQDGTQICTHLNQNAISGFLQGDSLATQQYILARSSLASAVAGALGISTATLNSDLASGKTVAALASTPAAQSKVSTAYLAATQHLLTQAVRGGIITSQQSQLIATMLQRSVHAGHYPLLDGGASGS